MLVTTISRRWLNKRLRRARNAGTLFAVPIIFGMLLLCGKIAPLIGNAGAIIVLLSSIAIVYVATTWLIYEPMVKCPNCDQSLWKCRKTWGKSHKARRDMTACPWCDTPIIFDERYGRD